MISTVRDIFEIPYDTVVERYNERLALLEARAGEFEHKKRQDRQLLERLLERYASPENHVAQEVEPRIRSLIRGTAIRAIGVGSPQARFAHQVLVDLESLIAVRETAVGGSEETRRNLAQMMGRLYDGIAAHYQLSTDTFAADIGLRQTAAVVSAESLARGKDEDGRSIPGQLFMTGYSILDLVKNTDFIGAVGIMLKQQPLTESERTHLAEYMCSRARLTDQERQIVDMNMANLSRDRTFNSKLLMKTVSQIMLHYFGTAPYIDLAPLNLSPGSSGKRKARRDSVFYGIADQGIEIGAKVMVATAYALRHLVKKKLGQSPAAADPGLNWGGNFLRFLYGEEVTANPDFSGHAGCLDDYFQIIRAHGAGNASSFATRVAGGAFADLAAALSTGCNVLSGDKHGFANYDVYVQLEPIYRKLRRQGEITYRMVEQEVERVWREQGSLAGIGHPVYNADPEGEEPGDPRAGVMIAMIESWKDPRIAAKFDFYLKWEAAAVKKLEQAKDKRFNFSANVDFYTPFLLQGRIGLPIEANTVMFELGRVFGHMAQYMEALQFGLVRSKTLYVGPKGLHLGA